MRILIVRHGETDHNVNRIMQGTLDTPLNTKGEVQAADVGRQIHAKEKIDGIYSSNLKRANRTAELIGNSGSTRKIPVEQIPELRERFMGPLQGMSHADAVAKMEREGKPSLKAYGESEEEMEARLANAWDILRERAQKNGHNTIVVVSHGSALTTLFAHLVSTNKVGFESAEVQKAFEENPRLSNCCVTIVENDKFTAFAEKWTDAIVRERDLL